MKIIAVSHKMPAWIKAGFEEYQKRLIKPWQLELTELQPKVEWDALAPMQIKAREAVLISKKIQPQDSCVALDVKGISLSTPMLAEKLMTWQAYGKNITFIIGGREGLDAQILERADFHWSLSPLTFPHQLVKVILAEQLYRAVTIINNHPYHRD